jgi:hypothetical protein
MTWGLFFTPTYPTYDPKVNFPFNFLNFQSDALICHLLFLCIILVHSFAICYFHAHHLSQPYLPPHSTACIKELILCNVLFGNSENISLNKLYCAHLLYLAPTPTNNMAEGGQCSSDYCLLLIHPTSSTNTVHPQEPTTTFRTVPPHQVNLVPYTNQALFRIWSLSR